jgi:hypothetical protein
MHVQKLLMTVSLLLFIFPGTSEAYIFDLWNLVVNEGETLTLSGHIKLANSVIINGTIIIPESHGTLILESPTIRIGPKGVINGNGAGYIDGPGAGQDTIECDVDMPGGGGYGGKGADGFAFGWTTYCSSEGVRSGGPTYGSKSFPDVHMGSGGGEYTLHLSGRYGARGGGAIKLIASDTVVVRGTLTVNGAEFNGPFDYPCWSGAGSGGGILISAPEVILMGFLSAAGGGDMYACTMCNGGGGGGGRIIICFTRLYRNLWSTFDVSGGDPAWCDSSFWIYPDAGTVSVLNMTKWPF